jgi:hypothetical protein
MNNQRNNQMSDNAERIGFSRLAIKHRMMSFKGLLTMRLSGFATIIGDAAVAAVLSAIAANVGSGAHIKIITAYNYPAATNTKGIQISNNGTIAGFFFDSRNVVKGFTRTSSGTFSPPIVDPNDNVGDTAALGVNRWGKVVGDFEQISGGVRTFHGFSLSKGVFTTFDVPGAFFTSSHGINDEGDFVGFYGTTNNFSQGSAFAVIEGKLTSFSVSGSAETSALGINNDETIVGFYADSSNVFHGFIRTERGKLLFPVDVPGATSTELLGINDKGVIAGLYNDGKGQHGVVMQVRHDEDEHEHDAPKVLATFDYPGATATLFRDINDSNVLSGDYFDGLGEHGFVAVLQRPDFDAQTVANP